MKNILFGFALLLGLGLATSSCNKNSDDDPAPKTVSELLTDHCWKLNAVIDECDIDNTEYFNADGTYLGDVGTDLCDPAEENTTGTWELSEDNTILTITTTGIIGITIEFTINEISETSMTLSIPGLVSGTYIKC